MEKFYLSSDKHMKGFMFDSLVFRFKEYQAKAFENDVRECMYRGSSREDAHSKVHSRHTRDLMRFIEILEEAIGEHD